MDKRRIVTRPAGIEVSSLRPASEGDISTLRTNTGSDDALYEEVDDAGAPYETPELRLTSASTDSSVYTQLDQQRGDANYTGLDIQRSIMSTNEYTGLDPHRRETSHYTTLGTLDQTVACYEQPKSRHEYTNNNYEISRAQIEAADVYYMTFE